MGLRKLIREANGKGNGIGRLSSKARDFNLQSFDQVASSLLIMVDWERVGMGMADHSG